MRRVEPVQIITVLLQCLLLCVLKQCSGQLTEPISSALAPFDYLALPFLKATGFQDYTCKVDKNDPKGVLNDFHLRGTALGGWLVLEPWLTPSLFYQFLGASEQWGDDAPKRVAIDSKTFCTALGKEEANRQLRNHWRTWVNESIVASLRESGVETLRIPVGDWMFVPYEPYIGCWDGAVEALDDMLDTIGRYNMTALIDVHALRDSQVILFIGQSTVPILQIINVILINSIIMHRSVVESAAEQRILTRKFCVRSFHERINTDFMIV